MDHGHLILLSTLYNNIVIMVILTLYGYELIILLLLESNGCELAVFNSACGVVKKTVCKGVLASEVHKVVYKMWPKCVQMCTSCTLQV